MPMQGVPEAYGPALPMPNVERPSSEQIVGAAWGQSAIGGWMRAAQDLDIPPVDGYQASWNDIKDNPLYADHAVEFAASRSPGQTDAIKARIDRATEERRTLASGGTLGMAASALADTPFMLLPGRVFIGALKDGVPWVRGALEVGAASAGQAAAQEPLLRYGDPTRTLGEGGISIASNAILGGLLGGAAPFLLPGERLGIAAKMGRERRVNDAHVMGQPPPAGAAATDTRTMEDLAVVPTGIGAEKLRDNAVTRSLQKDSLTVRRVAPELAETAVLVQGNLEGKTTTPGGMAPLETMARLAQNQTQVKILDTLEAAWKDTNFEGEKAPWAAKLRDDIASYGVPTGLDPSRTTFEEFSKQVSDAVMNNGVHDNPHVAEVAKQVQAVFDHWSERAEKAIPGFKRAAQYPDEGYFPHKWNKRKIEANRPEFADKLTDKYAADQAANAQTQRNVETIQGSLESHEANIKKYTRQLEKAQEDLELSEELRDEVRRQNKFGYQTAERMRESSYENVGGIREAAPEKNIEKARGGALFETQIRARGNELAEHALRHRNKVADLEEKLQAEHASAAELRTKLEEEIGKWHGQSHEEAMSAIKAREKAEAEREAKRAEGEPKGGRLRSADEAVDKAAQRIIESAQNKTPNELRDQAQETIDRILGSPDGRLPYDVSNAGSMPKFAGAPMQELRGSLHERALDVSHEFAKDWIERDVHKALQDYMRTFVPDVLLAERYGGDIEMEDVFRRINEDYSRLTDAARGNEKEVTRLAKERDGAIEDIAMMRDRLRGLFQIPVNASQRRIGRISAAVRNFSAFTSMGLGAIASIPDTAGVISRWGLNTTFNDAWAPFLKSLMTDRVYAKEMIRQFQVMGIGIEGITSSRHHSFHGITEPYAQGSLVERLLQKGADTMQVVNLMSAQTDILKTIASTVASTGIYRAAKAAAAGKATAKDLRALGESNIAPHLYERIAEQYEKHGTDIDGHILPNTEDWTDHQARAAFEAAVSRDANISVVTPGIDKPAFISDPVLAVFTQFKSFTAAATTRIMVANLQRADGHALQGLIASIGFGAMAYFVHGVATGQPLSDRPQDWVKEALSRGNVFGWLDEGNTLVSKMTRGRVDMYRALGADKPLSRNAASNAVENLMGPTFGKLVNLSKVTGAAATGEFTAGDINAMRRTVGYQNLWIWNRALTAAEKSLGNALGVPQQAQH